VFDAPDASLAARTEGTPASQIVRAILEELELRWPKLSLDVEAAHQELTAPFDCYGQDQEASWNSSVFYSC
jgi:hypothetical protein